MCHPLAELRGTRSAHSASYPPAFLPNSLFERQLGINTPSKPGRLGQQASKKSINQSTVEALVNFHAAVIVTVVRETSVRIVRNLMVSFFLAVNHSRDVCVCLTL
jgi:hypothetical protein